MAIPFDLSKIDARLDSLISKKGRLQYIRKCLFELEKQRAEFNVLDARELERLKPITQADFEKYHGFLDAGTLIYFSPMHDHFNADKFQNIGLLKKRLSLEHQIHHITSLIELFKAKWELEQGSPVKARAVQSQHMPSRFEELFTETHFAEMFRYMLLNFEPKLIDEKNRFVGPQGTKALIPMVIKEIERKGGMNKYPEKIQVKVLNDTFSGLKLSKDASEFRKPYKRLEGKEMDIKNLISYFPKKEKPGK